MKERTQLVLNLIGSHIVLIIGLIILSIFQTNYPFFTLAITQTVLCILYFSGYWEFFGLRFKKIFCAVMELIIVSVFVWKLFLGSDREVNAIVVFFLCLVQFFLLYELIRIIRVINEHESSAVEIEFPFKDGSYLVTDGGNSKTSRLMNYHYYSPTHKKNKTNNSMLYATDIVKLDGNNSNFLPKRNMDYPIFNQSIYCPMDGMIVKVVNEIPDNEPCSGNYPYNSGNTVVIKKDNLYLLLAHLKKNSIVVKEGALVQKNDPIGAAGNSGWTERPHLHMQLIKSDSDHYWFGKGVCIRYRNKNLYKDRLVRMR